jgi:guanylate kinase
MKLYMAICKDRHSDSVVRVFDAPDKAIRYAKTFTHENTSNPEDIKEYLNNAMKLLGWIYYAKYSSEGDNVRVEECELNYNDIYEDEK